MDGDLELGRRGAGSEAWRCRSVETWSSGGTVGARERGGVEVWRWGAREARCEAGDVEAPKRHEALELYLLESLAFFVPQGSSGTPLAVRFVFAGLINAHSPRPL